MFKFHVFKSIALATLFVGNTAGAASLGVTFSANKDTAAELQETVDTFRDALGANNGNDPVNGDPKGRRQINWDAAPDFISDPNEFPGDFFNGDAAPRARGIEFQATGYTTGFQLSSTEASGEPVAFGFEDDFVPFSPERMFTPVGGNTFKVNFFDPVDQSTPALSRGLGIVFNDVEAEDTTQMTLYDAVGNVLADEFALAGKNGGLSFLGVIFDEAVIAYAEITVGNLFFDGKDFVGKGHDAVVMDDFIFGEPVPGVAAVPLPASLPALLVGCLGLVALRGRQRRQQAA